LSLISGEFAALLVDILGCYENISAIVFNANALFKETKILLVFKSDTYFLSKAK